MFFFLGFPPLAFGLCASREQEFISLHYGETAGPNKTSSLQPAFLLQSHVACAALISSGNVARDAYISL